MGLFNWLAGLLGGKPDETVEEVAERLERVADRFEASGNEAEAQEARDAAEEARQSSHVADAKRIEAKFLRLHGLRPDGRPLKPVVGRGPNDTDYVHYGNTVRTGGSRAWRYNNPGYVRCSPMSSQYGAIGCDGEYAIFPDRHTGLRALHRTLRDEYPNHTVREALQEHLPAEAGVDPDRFCQEAGFDISAKIMDLTEKDYEAIAPALENQSSWNQGEEFDRGSADSPSWLESAWDSGNETTSELDRTESDSSNDSYSSDNS